MFGNNTFSEIDLAQRRPGNNSRNKIIKKDLESLGGLCNLLGNTSILRKRSKKKIIYSGKIYYQV